MLRKKLAGSDREQEPFSQLSATAKIWGVLFRCDTLMMGERGW